MLLPTFTLLFAVPFAFSTLSPRIPHALASGNMGAWVNKHVPGRLVYCQPNQRCVEVTAVGAPGKQQYLNEQMNSGNIAGPCCRRLWWCVLFDAPNASGRLPVRCYQARTNRGTWVGLSRGATSRGAPADAGRSTLPTCSPSRYTNRQRGAGGNRYGSNAQQRANRCQVWPGASLDERDDTSTRNVQLLYEHGFMAA